ncbi:unnamed protein product [Leuciscus chuanchicus]
MASEVRQGVSHLSLRNGCSDIEDNTATAQDKQVPKKPIKRPLEEVYGHNEVSESDAGVDVERSEQAECSSALVINDDVEEAKENEIVSQTVIKIAEKCSVDDTDGLSQYTDDSAEIREELAEEENAEAVNYVHPSLCPKVLRYAKRTLKKRTRKL